MVGNGQIPPYFRCNGCIIEQAMNCVNDLRKNASGSLQAGCKIASISETKNTACCPVYDEVSLKVDYKTSGYPQALACIDSVGCTLSQVFSL